MRRKSAPSPRHRKQPSAERPGPRPSPWGAVSALQRSAGNHALARRLGRASLTTTSSRLLQRRIGILPGPDSAERTVTLDLAAAAGLIRRNQLGNLRYAALAKLDADNAVFPSLASFLAGAQALSAQHIGPTLDEVAAITRAHTERVSAAIRPLESEESAMLRGIPSGSSFSSKMQESGELAAGLKSSEIEQLKARLKGFLEFAGRLPPRGTLPLYRTIKPSVEMKPGARLPHALPFSSTFSFSFARDWAHTPAFVILQFDALPTHAAVALSQLGDITGDLKPINQEQLEVTVAPAVIRVTGGPVALRGRNVFTAVLEPMSSTDTEKLLDQAITERKAGEAEAPKQPTLDGAKVESEFGEQVARTIFALAASSSAPAAAEVPIFTDKQGKRWRFKFGDDFFGYTFSEVK